MTDLEKWQQVFNEMGIAFSPQKNVDGNDCLHLETQTKGVAGYGAYIMEIEFDETGKFKQIFLGE